MIILDGTSAWHDWLEVVKMKACTDEVWEYVDPSLAADKVERLVAPLDTLSHWTLGP